MHCQPWEMEINARYARERVATTVAATRPLPAVARRRLAVPVPALGHVRQAVGRRLIAAGHRLIGPAASHPAAGPAA